MKLAADIVIRFGWPLLPSGLRERLSGSIHSAHCRATRKIPKSIVKVYGWGEPVLSLFKKKIVSPEIANLDFPPASLISTFKNERDGVCRWLDSLKAQTRFPKEVILCDGGSSDGTPEAIAQWKKEQSELPFELIVFREDGANIAAGRNRAIERARNEVILATDLGCTMAPDWVEKISTPFASAAPTDMVMGFYTVNASSSWAEAFSHFMNADLTFIDPAIFLPSGRSVAFTKSAWSRAGGYPEALTFAGEDSLFDIRVKETSAHIAFVPEALVSWDMPRNFSALSRMIYRYARGDAEGGELGWGHYTWLIGQAVCMLIESLGLLLFALLIARWPNPITIISAGIFGLSLLIRGIGIVRRYKPLRKTESFSTLQKTRRIIAACAIALSQLLGFMRGIPARKHVAAEAVQPESAVSKAASR